MNRQTLSRLKAVPYSQINEIPECIGVYFICLNDAVIYVGSSKKIRSRLKAHHKAADITRVTRWACEFGLSRPDSAVIKYKACSTIEEARLLEDECIKAFIPTLNWIESRENYIRHLEKKANVRFLDAEAQSQQGAA